MLNKEVEIVFMKTIVLVLLLVSFSSSELIGQNNGSGKHTETQNKVAVSSAAWDNLFIKNRGWFGGDGIFGIPLDGREFHTATDSTVTLFTFGDTMIGNHNGKEIGTGDFTMINNSVAFLEGLHPNSDKISFLYNTNDKNKPASLFVPKTKNSKEGHYYWLGDGFVNIDGDGKLYLFAYPIQNVDTTGIGGFGFEQVGVHILSAPMNNGIPDFDKTAQVELPFFNAEKQTSFGSAIYVNTKSAGAPYPDGYVYVYGVSNQDKRKGLIVARVASSNFLDFDKWRFWDGYTYVANIKKADYIAWDVSNEMSVSPLPNGKIALVYQYFTLSDEVALQTGASLQGPFGERKTIYRVPKEGWGENYFPYNAKAYPHLSSSDTLLISYNVNSFDFFNDILQAPNLYRPRFVKVALSHFE